MKTCKKIRTRLGLHINSNKLMYSSEIFAIVQSKIRTAYRYANKVTDNFIGQISAPLTIIIDTIEVVEINPNWKDSQVGEFYPYQLNGVPIFEVVWECLKPLNLEISTISKKLLSELGERL